MLIVQGEDCVRFGNDDNVTIHNRELTVMYYLLYFIRTSDTDSNEIRSRLSYTWRMCTEELLDQVGERDILHDQFLSTR